MFFLCVVDFEVVEECVDDGEVADVDDDVFESEVLKDGVGEGDEFCMCFGCVCADEFAACLPEFAVASFLWAVVAEAVAGVEEFERFGSHLELFDIESHDGCGEFGS